MQDNTKKRRTFFTDWWRKLSALALALLLFFNLNHAAKMTKTVKDVEIHVDSPAQEYIIRGYEPRKANLLVTCAHLAQEFEPGSFSVKVAIPDNLKLERASEVTLELSDGNIEVNQAYRQMYKGLKLSMIPDTGMKVKHLKVRLDRMRTRQVAVTVVTAPLENKEYTVITHLDEASRMVTLYGPSEELQAISEVRTRPLEFKGRDFSKPFRVMLELDDMNLTERGVRIEGQKTVPVNVEIIPSLALESRRFDGVPVSVLSSVESPFWVFFTGVERPRVNVVISGAPEVVRKFKETPPVACIDIRSVTDEGEQNVPVTVLNMNDASLKEVLISPKSFQIFVKRKQTEPDNTRSQSGK